MGCTGHMRDGAWARPRLSTVATTLRTKPSVNKNDATLSLPSNSASNSATRLSDSANAGKAVSAGASASTGFWGPDASGMGGGATGASGALATGGGAPGGSGGPEAGGRGGGAGGFGGAVPRGGGAPGASTGRSQNHQ